MGKFAAGDIKILICTNIVESGLDIQNANTIIIREVQQFGLAQLYQVFLVFCSSLKISSLKKGPLPKEFMYTMYPITPLVSHLWGSK